MNLFILLQNLPADSSIVEDVAKESFIVMALKGGWVMLPILLLSLVAVYIFFERWFAIKKAANIDENFMNRIKDYIM
ncbi:MAG: MotA/TolQ/ExbB proton channel family protein, partial [Bacteroidales bacterium]|nr:MotA/TolQ/ExbB proton channel family protein [Bacteroidales bacterium]